jgi:hypothetical protein
MAYTNDQINQFIKQKGVGNNPLAAYGYMQQAGVTSPEMDSARGFNPGTTQSWIDQQGFTPYGATQQIASDWDNKTGAFAQFAPGAQTAQAPAANPYLQQSAPRRPQQSQQTMAPPTQQQPQASPTQNPYLSGVPGFGQSPTTQWQANNMTQSVADLLGNRVMPGIEGGAIAAGGLGGSRQGVAQGLAMGEAAKGLSTGLANLYDSAYGRDQQYDLGSGALDLNIYNANQGWMRTGQQDQWNAMKDLYGMNRQGVADATTVQNTPLDYYSRFLGNSTQAGGMGNQNTQMLQGNPWLGAMGGYLMGTRLGG